MTEDEAKKKWCPMVRHAAQGLGGSCNTDMQTPMAEFYCCRGSDCMLWEHEYKTETVLRHKGKEPPQGEGWILTGQYPDSRNWKRYVPSGNGDCGLKSVELECRGM